MHDQFDPRRDRDPDGFRRWSAMQDRGSGYLGPLITIVAALFIGLLLLSWWDGNERPHTRVGENIERSATPDTPRDPNAIK
jgi:hypothetical protein